MGHIDFAAESDFFKEIISGFSLHEVQKMVDYNQISSPEKKICGVVKSIFRIDYCAEKCVECLSDRDISLGFVKPSLHPRYHATTKDDLVSLAEEGVLFSYLPLDALVSHFYWNSYDNGGSLEERRLLCSDGVPLRILREF